MSSDNGIYILETSGAKFGLSEFRVKHCQGIDNIYGKFNDETFHWDGDDKMIKDYFEDAPVFDNLVDALDKAENLSNNYDYLEYGICVIADFKDKVFSEL